ncbi:hypothetical protein [Runella slithyformis]|uniref:Uncharacterized protein n=1 Tax=Runella slithyformis (strain ATCC 29530 / DSM 19594 / LMG 11500 / NCIMB 11436 / LSU 4) TaxID=761193 RepID=A0A7U3ZNL3_RUNSL|nr:hypothetical protein [Runella slithyformis]AEI50521.1 hypothetical protein Runsl_4177 [Runella slithyformis DSM 19594]
MIKRLAALLFIPILMLSSVGIWLLFPLLQGFYRLKAHHVMEYKASELTVLHLKAGEFKRVGDDEIVHKNLRYDVESETLHGDIHEFRAYPDCLETQLLAFFEETWQGLTTASETRSPVSLWIQKMLSTDALCIWTYFDFKPAFTAHLFSFFHYLMADCRNYPAAFLLPPEE